MKNELPVLKLYNLSNPGMNTEWLSILGDKYAHSLNYTWTFVNDIEDAEVVIWDGLVTVKSQKILEPLIEDFKKSKVLLLAGEGETLFKDSKMVKLIDLDQMRYVEMFGRNTLPEDIINAIETCYQKLRHV